MPKKHACIGPETADSILLYAADKLIFPIDAYTIRLCKRLGVKDLKYEDLRRFFENSLPKDLEVYKEFHALIDKLGKTYCKVKTSCDGCPLVDECSLHERFFELNKFKFFKNLTSSWKQ